MAGKKVWLTWMPDGEGAPGPEQVVAGLAKVGLDVGGAKWVDDLEKVAWAELAASLMDAAGPDLWVVAGRRGEFESERNRYALSLSTAMIRDGRKSGPLMFLVGLDYGPKAEELPTLLRTFRLLAGSGAGWPAQVVAAAYGKPPAYAEEFRFNVISHPYVGQWFETGPVEGEWQGAMFGVAGGGEITHAAVGPRGQLPEKTVLEYALKGLKAQIGEDEYTAWAVQNRVGPGDSFYVKVSGFPAKIILGGHPGSDQSEVSVLVLK